MTTLVKSDDVLSLYEISHITISVNTSDQKPLAWSPAVLLRDQSKVKLIVVLLESLYVKESKDARDLKWSILNSLKVLEQVRVEGKVRNVANCIRVSQLKLSLILIKIEVCVYIIYIHSFVDIHLDGFR